MAAAPKAATIHLSWRGGRAFQQLRTAAVLGARKSVKIIRIEAINLILNTPKTGNIYGGHQASAPGEPPASESGKLVRSFREGYEVKGTIVTAALGNTDPKALELEKGNARIAARPFMAPAAENMKDIVLKAVAYELSLVLAKP